MTTSFYGVEVREQGGPGAAATAEVLDMFEILKPKASKTPLIRIGGDIDGSYLVPDELDGIAACFSPGVNRIKYFEDFLTDHYGIKSHMCDFSCDVTDFKTPLKDGMQTFAKKWLDVSPGEDNISLEDWIAEHAIDGDLLLQMDIEGAEYRNILATSDETLARFRVMVLEVHGLTKMLDAPILRGVFAPFFTKIAGGFTCVHAHPNNCCGDFLVPGTDIRIPHVLELTFVRNDRFNPAPAPVLLPHPLDVSRNVPRNPPLFLSDAWCDHERPLESRIRMLEEAQRYREEVGSTNATDELAGVLSLTMQSLQTVAGSVPSRRAQDGNLVEVAGGRHYLLSSAYGSSKRRGVVQPRKPYFFHTGFGASQSIRVDLGRRRRIRRIEVTNRSDGHQERAKFIFATLSVGKARETSVFPMYKEGKLHHDAWLECELDVPDVEARFVTITSPANTALHFSDLRVYAVDEADPARPSAREAATAGARWAIRGLSSRARRPRASAPSVSERPVRGADDTVTGSGFYVLDNCANFDVPVSGLIHVGANRGNEYPTYHAGTHGPLLYLEAIPEMAEFVRQRLDPHRPHFVRQAAVSDVAGETVSFHVASNDGGSSSLLEPGRHADLYPSITFDTSLELVTERLDDIVAERPEADGYNVLLLDVQGAELKVLRGAPKLLSRVDAVFTEVAAEPLYEGGCTFHEVTNLLAESGLVFRAAQMNAKGWGDAFYSRTRGTLDEMLRKNLALGKPTRQSSYHRRTIDDERVVTDVLPHDFGVHTLRNDDHPWWEVDLGEVSDLSRIVYLDRPTHLRAGASLRISTSRDGQQYDAVYRRNGHPLQQVVDVAASTSARFVRVSVEEGGPLHFRKLIVL